MTTLPKCADCTHYRRAPFWPYLWGSKWADCHHPEAAIYAHEPLFYLGKDERPVTDYYFCKDMRASEDRCGKHARFFEAP